MLWVIADRKGLLQGLLHVHRNSGYAKDIIVLASHSTSKNYLDYLSERNYDFIVAGNDHVDYRAALDELGTRHGVKTVVTDSGGVLTSVLLAGGLVDEVRLLVSLQIVGKPAVTLLEA